MAAIPTRMKNKKTNMTDETNTQNENEVQDNEQNEPKKENTINGWSMNTDNTGYTDSGTPVYLGD